MKWLSWWRPARRRSPFNNWGPQGLTCGRVSPYLLVGGELGPDDWPALAQEGVSVVINLQAEQQDVFAPNERLNASLWLPAPDGLAPTLEQLALGVELIESSARAGKTVFVHCKAGQGRAPLLCACYLIRDQKLTPLQAIGQVRQARTRTQLTPEQNIRLREYAAWEAERDASVSQVASNPPEATISNSSITTAPAATTSGELKPVGVLTARLQAAAQQNAGQPNGRGRHEPRAGVFESQDADKNGVDENDNDAAPHQPPRD